MNYLHVPLPLWILAFMVPSWYLRAPLKNRRCEQIKPVVFLILLVPLLLAAIVRACSIGRDWLFNVAAVPFVLVLFFAVGCLIYNDYKLFTGRGSLD
jgi:hypothetical protein